MIRFLALLTISVSLAGCETFQLPPIKVKACYVDDSGNQVCLSSSKADGIELSGAYRSKDGKTVIQPE